MSVASNMHVYKLLSLYFVKVKLYKCDDVIRLTPKISHETSITIF